MTIDEKTMKRLAKWIGALMSAALLITIWACNKTVHAPIAEPGAATMLDRTVLPIAEPTYSGDHRARRAQCEGSADI